MCISLKYFTFLIICITGVLCQNGSNVTNSTGMMSTNLPLSTVGPTSQPIVYCSLKKRIPGCVQPPKIPDPFEQLDKKMVFIVQSLLKYDQSDLINNKSAIAEMASESKRQDLVNDIDRLDSNWKFDCRVSDSIRKFLEEDFIKSCKANPQTESHATLTRYLKTLACKKDCNFDAILKAPNNTNSNLSREIDDMTTLVPKLFKEITPKVKTQCRRTIGKYLVPPADASALKNNIDGITLLNPTKLGNFSQSDTLEIAKKLHQNGMKLDRKAAKNLAKNIPKTADAKDLLSLASSIPLECFNNTNASDLVAGFEQMDLENMAKSRKSFIAKKIMKSGSKSDIENFMKKNTDKSMMRAITSKMIEDLNIDITQIPAKNLPKSYMRRYANNMLKNSSVSLEQITDLTVLGKVIAGVKKSNLKKIPKSARLSAIYNMVKASLDSEVPLSSNQRRDMRDSLVEALIELNGTSPVDYLSMLNSTQVKVLFPLFIEAPNEVLTAFSQLETFSDMASESISKITADNCCSYLRSSRQLFATFAINTITTNEILSYSDLISLGTCFASTIPSALLKTLNSTEFMNYYPDNGGKSFQPDSTETETVKSHITSAASGDAEDYVFNTLKDLAIFYSSFSSLNSSQLKENGAGVVSKVKESRDTSNTDIQMCRLGLSSSSLDSLITNVGKSYVDAYIASLSSSKRRRRRSTTALTCDQLNDLSDSLNSIPTSNLAAITNAEFTECMSLLGASTNAWSSEQLSTLAGLARTKYSNNITSISDADIASLNAITMGFTTSELSQLVFTTTDGITALGALTGWTADQYTNGLGPAVKRYLALDGQNITSDDVSAMNNLACSLDTATTDSMTDAVFVDSVPTLSGLTGSNCPNIGVYYAKAVASSSYGSSIYNSTDMLSELGTIIAGITTTDLAQLSSEDISSLDEGVWAIMPVSTVNSLSTDQIQGISAEGLNGIQNSPNYDSYSSSLKSSVSSLSTGGDGTPTTTSTSFANVISFNLVTLVFSTILAIFGMSL